MRTNNDEPASLSILIAEVLVTLEQALASALVGTSGQIAPT